MLKFDRLTKWFGSKCAVSNLSFEVRRGQVLGLLGPNGAGKSTSMKMTAGYLRPSSGVVTLGGHDVWKAPLKAKSLLGYLPESTPLYQDLICSEYLAYIARLRGIKGKETRRAIDSVVDACFLQPVRQQSISTLSKGYRHRLCLAQSLLGDPEILIFDEPTDGLDPNQKQEIRDLINRIASDKAIVISTHILEEVEAVCSDVLIINQGEKVFSGTPETLKTESAVQTLYNLQVKGENPLRLIERLEALEAVESIAQTSHQQSIHHLALTLTAKIDIHVADGLYREVGRITDEEGGTVVSFAPDQGEIGKSFRNLTMNSQSNF